ncbi:META domain-containing protein [Treponema phagedenis]|uniref:META domain-containing protein n=1 Tax=Treponema phagedenis TaxID=162 RepID=A0A0B7GWS9_TREPH|nr:META domain-containing protein [Treponema phagedenis]NVP24371.1 META domain-containing protein [Treponema phagedenis]QEJ96066.1 META domain-containing protein [Treponema phagedenis]QEJ99035.1 META domain-containing protein [Treponema phagedenis]QEK01829.1 META domain-containing protein [Treponema phagedenis]QEK04545.1 META domain-containing protein [Treponema phagedenis]
MKKYQCIMFSMVLIPLVLGSCRSTGQYTDSKVKKISSFETDFTQNIWLLAGYRSEQGFIPLEPEHGSFGKIKFESDGKFSATSGVNLGNGSWKKGKKVSENLYALSLGTIGVTRMAAENEISAKFDSDFFTLLGKTAYIQFEADGFKLLDEKQEQLLYFIFSQNNAIW